ncbi:MAG: adenosine deaminase family protein [Kiritimatiellae bacterium]|nr:adenosine deaminase family protein [Kiritimatiellia bacterium]
MNENLPLRPTAEWLQRIPKTDLHVHLDGSLRIPTLVELARASGVALPSETEEGLRALVFKDHYANLTEYLRGFAYTTAVLRTPEHLERVAFELAEDNLAEGVRYIEVRFAPQLHYHADLHMRDVLAAVNRGLARAAQRHNQSEAVRSGADLPFHYGIIVCALRAFTRQYGPYFAALLDLLGAAPRKEVFSIASLEVVRTAVAIRDRDGLPIVGFDLAGEEAGYPAQDHREAYQYAHRWFLRKTVHAGEAYGPESIFQAITDCHANRIGHGTFLFAADMVRGPGIADAARYVEQLAEYIASQRITIEVCLTSNLQTTPSIRSVAEHPVRLMIERGLSVTICTDNRLVSHTTVTRELERLTAGVPLSARQFRNVIVAGFKGAFMPLRYVEKRAYVHQVIERLNECLRDAPALSAGETR